LMVNKLNKKPAMIAGFLF